jgi:hypothetical protein
MGLPLVGQKAIGFRTFFGTWVAPGSNVTFLGPAGVFESTFTENNRVSTLNAALARCRSGKNDVIIALPGYAETVSSADYATSLVAGTQLVAVPGLNSTQMPTLTFSATTSTFLLDVADVLISGFKFVPSIDAVANYLTVSAAGCKVMDCVFNCGTSSALDVTNPILVNAGSDDFEFGNNRLFSLSTAVNTNGLLVQGAIQGLSIHDNDFDLSISGATSGVIEIGAFAVGQGRIMRNIIRNRRAAAAVGIRLADTAGSEGSIYDNYFNLAADVTVVGGTISAAGSSNHAWRAFQNFGHDENIGTALVGGIGTGTIE